MQEKHLEQLYNYAYGNFVCLFLRRIDPSGVYQNLEAKAPDHRHFRWVDVVPTRGARFGVGIFVKKSYET